MSFLFSLMIGCLTLIAATFSYFYMKSAIFRYIIRNPMALVSLIKHAPKTEEEKIEAMMTDTYLSNMFKDKEIQQEMKKNMQIMMEMEQKKRLSIQKKWQQIKEKQDEDIIDDETNNEDEISELASKTDEDTSNNAKKSSQKVTSEEVSSEEVTSEDVTSEKITSEEVTDEVTDEIPSLKATSEESTSEESTSDDANQMKESTGDSTLPNNYYNPPKPDFSNPMFRKIIQNPEMMLAMMPETPQKSQLEKALKNPMMRQMMTNPDLMKSMLETMPPPDNQNSFMNN